MGTLLLCLALGSLIALPTAGLVVGRIGTANTVRAAGLVAAAAGVGVASSLLQNPSRAPPSSLFFFGIGIGLWDVSQNIEGADVEHKLGRTIMPQFHAAFSGGAFLGALIGAGLSTLGVGLPHAGLARAVLRATRGGGHRSVEASRLDRRRAVPQHPRRRLRGLRLPGQPRRRAGGRRPWLPLGRGDPGAVDLAVICLPGRAVSRRQRRHCAGRSRPRRDLRRLRRDRRRRARRQEQLLALVRAHGARLLGPNCLGIAVSAARLNATFAPRALPARHDRVLLAERRARAGAARGGGERGLGLSAFVSVGNKADVSANDLLEWWEDDDATGSCCCTSSPSATRARSRGIARASRAQADPGAQERLHRAPAAGREPHTAALAGSDAAVDALFRQAGVIRARTLEELVDVAALLSNAAGARGPARCAC